ncbi:MAG: phosphoribosylaminoimidazole-succinocarboxamide synthase, partial [Gammaproteobacteria bacterium]
MTFNENFLPELNSILQRGTSQIEIRASPGIVALLPPLSAMTEAVFETTITSLPLLHSGKVRDCYAVGEEHMLIIATDRLSAFDVILPIPMPGKGKLLTQIAEFWFNFFANLIPNHYADLKLEDVLTNPAELKQAEGRSMLVKKLDALPVEAVMRGYIIGSGWKDYQANGAICGIDLPAGLQLADKLQQPIFTPAHKAKAGDHDENISFAQVVTTIGEEMANKMRSVSLDIYQKARQYAAERGIIIADTKFEFGLDKNQTLTLMDEVLTPDSSRFWPAEQWQPGKNPASFDKQIVRDYLETLDWDKTAPGPKLPDAILNQTLDQYREVISRL